MGLTISVIGIIVALLSPVVTYLIAARKLSGRIKNSDATELWAESRSIREWSTERNKELSDLVEQLEQRLGEVERVNSSLAEENRRLLREVVELRGENQSLKSKVISLTSELEIARNEIAQLRRQTGHRRE